MPTIGVTRRRSVRSAIYNLLTGQHPHDAAGDRLAYLQALLLDHPVPIRSRRPELPAALVGAIDRELCSRPHDHFAEIVADSDASLEGRCDWLGLTSCDSFIGNSPPRRAKMQDALPSSVAMVAPLMRPAET